MLHYDNLANKVLLSRRHDSRVFGRSLVTFTTSLQVLSTPLKRLASPGSCFMISGESKIGYKYYHVFEHLIHSSTTLEM